MHKRPASSLFRCMYRPRTSQRTALFLLDLAVPVRFQQFGELFDLLGDLLAVVRIANGQAAGHNLHNLHRGGVFGKILFWASSYGLCCASARWWEL